MFAEVSTEFVAKQVASYMASFLLDQGGSNLFECMKKRAERQKFKNQEKSFFEYHFQDVKDKNELEIILNFLNGKVALENLWYSHEDKISIEQQELMWLEFQNYKKRESGDSYAPLAYKEELTACINFHNKLVNELIVNDNDHFVIKTLQSEQKEMEESIKKTVKETGKEMEKEMEEVIKEVVKESVKETVEGTMSKAKKKAMSINRSTGESNKDNSLNPRINTIKMWSNWLMYTLSVGCLPFVIKYLTGIIYGRKLILDDYYTEIFFMTIVFLIDAIRNFNDSDNGFAEFAEKLAILILILSASTYGSILTTRFDDVISYLKISLVFLYLSCALDFLSIMRIIRT